jgi:hypothetical protein
MTKRSRILSYGLCGVLVLLGVLAAIFVSDGTGEVLAFVFMALGFVLATSLVFYEVGLSEDRELDREERTRRARQEQRRARPSFRFTRERDHNRRLR